jgi:hypothetical protein
MKVTAISNSPISEEYESRESPRAEIESVKVPDWRKPDPKLLDPVWEREVTLKIIRSAMEGFIAYWTEKLGGVEKIDPRLKSMSALEVNEIYMSSLPRKRSDTIIGIT